jgi:hypothetical protein
MTRKRPHSLTWPQRITGAIRQSGKGFFAMLPVMLGTLLLTSLLIPFIPRLFDAGLFGLHPAVDAVTGAAIGSVAAGQPVVSYLLAGELGHGGVALIGVTALVVAWVTVGITQLPVEAITLGRRFAIMRNLLSFASALAIAFIISGAIHVVS